VRGPGSFLGAGRERNNGQSNILLWERSKPVRGPGSFLGAGRERNQGPRKILLLAEKQATEVSEYFTHGEAALRGPGSFLVFQVWPSETDLRSRNAEVDPLMRRWPVPYALSIGRVRCGDWASSVPDLLEADGRLGVALDETPAQARRTFENAVAEACEQDGWLRDHPVEVEWWGGQLASGRLPASSDLLERVRAAHMAAVGAGAREPAVWGAPYGSDLRLLTGIGGIPALHCGPGDAALAHAPDESVSLEEVATCARALALLAVDYVN